MLGANFVMEEGRSVVDEKPVTGSGGAESTVDSLLTLPSSKGAGYQPDRRVAQESAGVQLNDDVATICAISVVAAMLGTLLHEGVGHAAIALLTGAKSGVLSTVAWSSEFDTRLVAAGGTLVNLAAAAIFWMALRSAKDASVRWRFFLLISVASNLLTGTGYFFFSGVTNFGDWAAVIEGVHPHWLWRTLLVVGGIASYYGAVLTVGIGLVRYVGVSRNDSRRLRKLTYLPYFSSAVTLTAGGVLNPIGMQLVWQSALPASAGAKSGLLWLQYYIPKKTIPERGTESIARSYAWIATSLALLAVFVFVLGRGITLRR